MTRKRFLSPTFDVQYFNQKTPSDPPISHFLHGNIQDNINTFDGNKIYFFVKLCTNERRGDFQSIPFHHSIKTSRVEKKIVKRNPKQSDLHGKLNFLKKVRIIKKMPPVVHFQPSLHFLKWAKEMLIGKC